MNRVFYLTETLSEHILASGRFSLYFVKFTFEYFVNLKLFATDTVSCHSFGELPKRVSLTSLQTLLLKIRSSSIVLCRAYR